MHFLGPLGVQSLLNLLWILPIAGAIVVMYMLKLRRKDVVVSSTFLWRQVVRDVQANAPFQKLRKNLLMFVQLLIAALIVFALSGPVWRWYGIGGRNTVIIIDTSASMRATDVSPTRLDEARREALKLVDAMRPGDMTMVLSASSRPEAVTGFVSREDRTELRRAIDALKAHDTQTNMREALNLAADLVASRNSGDNGRIEMISDGAFDTDGSSGSPLSNISLGKTRLTFHPVGIGHDNVGITAVDFRRNLGSEKTVQLLVVTHNYSAQPKKFTEEIYDEAELKDAHEVNLPPGGESTEPYDIVEPDSPRKVRIHLDLKDDLLADNDAALILKPRKTLKVLLIGQDYLFLENALKVDPGVALSTASGYPDVQAAKAYDVVVFYNAAPAKLPPGNYLFVHCTGDQAPARTEGEVQNVGAADWEKEHPVLRYVDLSNERFPEALKAKPQGWGHELAVGESGSLIVSGEKDQKRSLFVGFDPNRSRFPLSVAFPIFVSNSIRWLGTGSDDSELAQIHTGAPITIPVPPGTNKVTITRPDNSRREIAVTSHNQAIFDEADQIGLYTASGPGFSYPFAANLASPAESDITPHRSVTVMTDPTVVTGHRVADNRPLLPVIALLALALLCLEWWLFHRRIHLN